MALHTAGDPDYGHLLLDINITGGIKDARVTERVKCGKFLEEEQTSVFSL